MSGALKRALQQRASLLDWLLMSPSTASADFDSLVSNVRAASIKLKPVIVKNNIATFRYKIFPDLSLSTIVQRRMIFGIEKSTGVSRIARTSEMLKMQEAIHMKHLFAKPPWRVRINFFIGKALRWAEEMGLDPTESMSVSSSRSISDEINTGGLPPESDNIGPIDVERGWYVSSSNIGSRPVQGGQNRILFSSSSSSDDGPGGPINYVPKK